MSAIGRTVFALRHAHFYRFSLKWPHAAIRKRPYLCNPWANCAEIGVYGKLISLEIHFYSHFLCRSNLKCIDLFTFNLTLNFTLWDRLREHYFRKNLYPYMFSTLYQKIGVTFFFVCLLYLLKVQGSVQIMYLYTMHCICVHSYSTVKHSTCGYQTRIVSLSVCLSLLSLK